LDGGGDERAVGVCRQVARVTQGGEGVDEGLEGAVGGERRKKLFLNRRLRKDN
jgi:hypothetical protein